MISTIRVGLAIALGLCLAGCSDEPSAEQNTEGKCSSAGNVLLCKAPLLIAHRGGAKLAPEETLPAFENAVALDADVLELDVHSTADDEVVCLHDDTVDRTTDGSGRVHDLTLAELRKLDAGHDFSPDDGSTFPWRGRGVTVPTLAEVLGAHPDQWFSIEIKQTSPNIVDRTLAVIDAAGVSERIVLVAFSDDVVEEIRAKRPDVLTGMGLGEMVAFSSLSDETEVDYQPPTLIVQPPIEMVTAERVARANRLGMRLHAWTINDRDEMQALLDLGTHGIMTDDPALLREVLDAR